MADLGWLRYAAPDQVPILREVDRRARPWREVPDVARCPACLGALPPDTEAACAECGTGSWRPRVAPAPVLPERGVSSSWATFPNPPEEPAAGTRVTWVPQSADPEHPTLAELEGGIDLTSFLRMNTVAPSPSVAEVTQPVPLWSSGPLGDVEDWENGDVVLTLKRRRPWWMFWRRRG